MKTKQKKNVVTEDSWDIEITSKRKKFQLGLKETFKYRDLVYLFFKRDFTAFYKQTILGPFWYIIQPLLTTLIFSFVFGRLAGIGTEGIPQYLFYLSGIIYWQFFAQTLTKISNAFTANLPLFGKVYFPRLAVIISTIFSNSISFFIQFFMFIIFYIYFAFHGMIISIHWSFALFPLVFIQIALIAAGFGLMVSSLTTKYRDLKFLISFGLQLWMYVSPIVYPISELPEKLKWIIWLNPVAFPIETFRFMVFQTNEVNWKYGIISIAITLVLVIAGIMNFNRVEKDFLDKI